MTQGDPSAPKLIRDRSGRHGLDRRAGIGWMIRLGLSANQRFSPLCGEHQAIDSAANSEQCDMIARRHKSALGGDGERDRQGHRSRVP